MLPNTNNMTVSEAAQALANAGCRIFPCSSGVGQQPPKVPKVKDWANVATNDLGKVQKWWLSETVNAIGLPTGGCQSTKDGCALIVIDTDLKPDENGEVSLKALEEKLGSLPETYTVRTPSGGRHRYFHVPEASEVRNSSRQLGDGIDVRGSGGYVVAPGSKMHGGGRYEVISDVQVADLPGQWVARLRNGKTAKAGHGFGKSTRKSSFSNTDCSLGLISDAVIAVRNAPPGGRNDTLNREAFSLGQYVGRGDLDADEVRDALIDACHDNGLVQDDGLDSVEKTIESGLKAGIDEPLPMSEDRLAVVFAERFENQYLFDHTRGQWFYWDGSLWREDLLKKAFMAARELIRTETNGKPNFNRTATASAVLKAASADQKIAIGHDGWNSDPWMLGVPDGVVDLQTGKHLPPDPGKRIYMATSVSPAPPGTPYPKWDCFIAEATNRDPDLVLYLQQVCGYLLTGCTHEEIFFFVHGPGGNGKGVFIGAIGAIMGDYAKAAAMETFMASKGERHLAELARLAHARLVTASETEEGRSLAVARIKELTGNERPITANFMRQNHFEFVPQFKLVLAGNNKPKIRSVDKAIERRLRLLPFTHQPATPNPKLKEELVDEYPAILRWAIDGCLSWQQQGFSTPSCVEVATKEYLDEEDTKAEWLEARVIDDPEAFTSSADLFRSWEVFASSNHYFPGKKNDLSRWLKAREYEAIKQNGVRGFKGLKIGPPEEFAKDDDEAGVGAKA